MASIFDFLREMVPCKACREHALMCILLVVAEASLLCSALCAFFDNGKDRTCLHKPLHTFLCRQVLPSLLKQAGDHPVDSYCKRFPYKCQVRHLLGSFLRTKTQSTFQCNGFSCHVLEVRRCQLYAYSADFQFRITKVSHRRCLHVLSNASG